MSLHEAFCDLARAREERALALAEQEARHAALAARLDLPYLTDEQCAAVDDTSEQAVRP